MRYIDLTDQQLARVIHYAHGTLDNCPNGAPEFHKEIQAEWRKNHRKGTGPIKFRGLYFTREQLMQYRSDFRQENDNLSPLELLAIVQPENSKEADDLFWGDGCDKINRIAKAIFDTETPWSPCQ